MFGGTTSYRVAQDARLEEHGIRICEPFPKTTGVMCNYRRAQKIADKRQHDSFRKFCEEVEGVKETARLQRILSKCRTLPAVL